MAGSVTTSCSSDRAEKWSGVASDAVARNLPPCLAVPLSDNHLVARSTAEGREGPPTECPGPDEVLSAFKPHPAATVRTGQAPDAIGIRTSATAKRIAVLRRLDDHGPTTFRAAN